MNDEVNHEMANKMVSITFQASRMSADILKKAISQYLKKRQEGKTQEPDHGKMSVKELMEQNQGASTIEVNGKTSRSFERIVRKYNVDFAMKKDSSQDPPKYIVFFKGKDKDVINQALGEYVRLNEIKQKRKSLHKKLEEKKEDIKNNDKSVVKENNKDKKRTRKKERSR